MRDQLQAPPEVSAVAVALGVSLRAMIAAVPGAPHKPTPLARLLGLSRVTTSKLLSALRRDDPAELLGVIPGPESLRIAASGAAELGVDAALVEGATKAIDEFAALIGDGFGTRDALHAAIVGRSGTLRSKVEESARAEVFKGLRQIIGVEANTWLTSMLFMPGTPEEVVAVTTIHGALGMRRLRRETPVYFTFGPPYHDPANDAVPSPSQVSLLDYCTNEPAALETKVVGEQLRYRLVDGPVGKHAVSDMLVVSHNAQGSRKYATPGSPLRGVSLFVDIPARMLVCDAIVHRDVFPDREPELMVFNPGALDGLTGTYLTSLRFNATWKRRLAELVHAYPGISIFDVDALLQQVRNVMDRAALAVQAVFLFALAAGTAVLLAAVQATRDERRYESAILRTLGARRAVVLTGVATEFLALGLLAGILAATGAVIVGWFLATQVFGFGYTADPWVWIWGIGAGVLIVGGTGTLAARSVVRQSPLATLHGD